MIKENGRTFVRPFSKESVYYLRINRNNRLTLFKKCGIIGRSRQLFEPVIVYINLKGITINFFAVNMDKIDVLCYNRSRKCKIDRLNGFSFKAVPTALPALNRADLARRCLRPDEVRRRFKTRIDEMKIYHSNLGDDNNRSSKEYLEINGCGVSNYEFGDYTTIREKGRKDYQLIYIKKGKLRAQIIDKTVNITAGKLLFYHPGDVQWYSYRSKDKYESAWCQFSGTGVADILKQLNIFEQRIFHPNNSDELEYLISKLLPEHRIKRPGYRVAENALLLQILCQLSRTDGQSTAKPTTPEQKIEHVLLKMENSLTKNYTLSDYAKEIHLSPGRFSHLFTETMGVSPHQYILNLKIEKAKQLFRQTDQNVQEVAEFTGFDDPLYFSRIFKKHVGMTPTAYKSQHFEE